MLLVEERLFPGDELAAAMSAAAAAAAASSATATAAAAVGGGDGDGQATADTTTTPTTAAAAVVVPEGAGEGGRRLSLSSPGELSSDMEGGWGEDGTTAGSLSHLVECMLEVSEREAVRGWKRGLGGLVVFCLVDRCFFLSSIRTHVRTHTYIWDTKSMYVDKSVVINIP